MPWVKHAFDVDCRRPSTHAQNMFTTCSQHAQDKLKTSSSQAHNKPRLCPQHAHNIPTTCPKHARASREPPEAGSRGHAAAASVGRVECTREGWHISYLADPAGTPRLWLRTSTEHSTARQSIHPPKQPSPAPAPAPVRRRAWPCRGGLGSGGETRWRCMVYGRITGRSGVRQKAHGGMIPRYPPGANTASARRRKSTAPPPAPPVPVGLVVVFVRSLQPSCAAPGRCGTWPERGSSPRRSLPQTSVGVSVKDRDDARKAEPRTSGRPNTENARVQILNDAVLVDETVGSRVKRRQQTVSCRS
jgi:hypothetical protein